MADAKDFDTRAWLVAVGIVLSALVILSTGICIVLYKEWNEEEPGRLHQLLVLVLLVLDYGLMFLLLTVAT